MGDEELLAEYRKTQKIQMHALVVAWREADEEVQEAFKSALDDAYIEDSNITAFISPEFQLSSQEAAQIKEANPRIRALVEIAREIGLVAKDEISEIALRTI